MKVAVFLADSLAPAAGGNFSYYDRLIRAIDDYKFSEPLDICFVGRIDNAQVRLDKPYFRLAAQWLDGLFLILRKTGIASIVLRRFAINIDLANRVDLSRLRRNKIDLILVPKQFARAPDNFPFMTINWDAAHKSSYAFPEFVDNYAGRDEWFRVEIQRGMAILVESESSKKEFAEYYAISQNKLEVVPLFPGGVVDMRVSEDMQTALLKKFELTRNSYFFYPAQFWAHKNHYNLICAFGDVLQQSGRSDLKLILTGSDKGNKEYIRSVIREKNLKGNVIILGFVSNEEMYTLYKDAIALVMATFLGPTNMPVLEAGAIGTAVICSDLAGHRETCGDGAIYVDPVDQAQWTKAMIDVLDSNFRTALLVRAAAVHQKSEFTVNGAIKRLEKVLLKFIPIRKTFG